MMGVICKKKVGEIIGSHKYLVRVTANAVSAKPRWGGGGGVWGWHATPTPELFLKVIVAMLSVSAHPMYTVHAQNI